MKSVILFAVIILGLVGLEACQEGTSYERMERRELAGGERYDSLFLGLYLGMPDRDFFAHCFDLNRKRLVKQGAAGAVVEYVLPDQNPKILMNFFPDFYEEKICQMPVRFSYQAWAPWNRELQSDSLQQRLMPMLLDWYGGNEFIKLKDDIFGPVYAKVDGNRRIILTCEDVHFVRAVFSDLLALKEAKEEGDGQVRQ